MRRKLLNADKPRRWKADVAASVDRFNEWFMRFAPEAFRKTRFETTERVKGALLVTNNLRRLSANVLQAHPEVLSSLRMATAPPLAVDRLIGLSDVNKNLVKRMEKGSLPTKMRPAPLDRQLRSMSVVIARLLDRDIFPWLQSGNEPTEHEQTRASTIVADRLCSAVANPIVRNAQERRQLTMIGEFLDARGYSIQTHPADKPITEMPAGTYAIRMNVPVGESYRVKLPVDVAIQPRKVRRDRLPILVEAKSAGDFTNTNKRRKEEATKIRQLRAAYGEGVQYLLFLCGYFGTDYLGYEAAEGIDWVWEHRIDDLLRTGI